MFPETSQSRWILVTVSFTFIALVDNLLSDLQKGKSNQAELS